MSVTAKLLLFLALVGFNHGAHAATYANFQVGSFNPALTPAYFALAKTESVNLGPLGNFLTSISTTGSSWGLGADSLPRPPTGVAINSSWVDPAFPGDVTNLNVLAFYGSSGNTVSILMDFSTLSGGFLPVGSVIAFNDIDGLEQTTLAGPAGWYSLAAGNFFQAGVNVGSPWGSGQPSPTPADAPSTAGSTAANLILNGSPANTDGITNFIITQVNMTSLTITTHDLDNTQFAQALAIGIVPEPAVSWMLGLTGLMAIWQRRRNRPAIV